ncbi:hypothetical protein EDB81DRAFT_700705 [Dactylonectria macrodidyma]|uniref:Zn(2)-C6 fungal-type domain-containing protein n=1 Tax=Dactylonectria macrodidyma TaxID=307937 RepID=A0A9P9DJR5_9HYPO|nr:hypothetical protein EDB81DRAFT_700705 [Dactylonectria macrodidyma]
MAAELWAEAAAKASPQRQDEGSDSPAHDSPAPIIRRACDACRTRKIRCDRKSPCSYCSQAKIPCIQANTRPKEKRTRILLSAQYERKIDVIDSRLEEVTRLLEELQTNLATPAVHAIQTIGSSGSSPRPPIPASSSAHFGHVVRRASDSPAIQGESTLAAHSVFANEFLQGAVQTDAIPDSSNIEFRDALSSLHHVVDSMNQQNGANDMSYPDAHPVECVSFRGNELPPMKLTVALIRAAKAAPTEMATMIHEFSPLENFSELCLHVYFSENYSQADFITANAGLLYLYTEYMARTPEKEDEIIPYVEMCRANLQTALANLPLHVPATSRMIGALLLGSFHAIDISRPSLCWTLVSKASELCQTLGYHQSSSMKNDDAKTIRRKSFLFWNVYMIEKSLSLRLGRASTIPDWAVTVSIPGMEDFYPNPLSPYISLWIRTAKCQGSIYEILFSPNSVLQPDHVRESRVQSLANDLTEIRSEQYGMSSKLVNKMVEKIGKPMSKFTFITDDILRLSLLTLVYRASRSPLKKHTTFIPECIEAARATLERHQDCMKFLEQSHASYYSAYVQWTLLYAPFVPFIVVFCQVIETRDEMDLARLESFINSMDSAPPVLDAAANMYRLFHALYKVAVRYIEFRNSTPPAGPTKTGAQLNNCLNALGFTNVGLEAGQQDTSGMFQGQIDSTGSFMGDDAIDSFMEGQQEINPIWTSDPAQLDGWFNNNNQVMEFIEQTSFDSHLDERSGGTQLE